MTQALENVFVMMVFPEKTAVIVNQLVHNQILLTIFKFEFMLTDTKRNDQNIDRLHQVQFRGLERGRSLDSNVVPTNSYPAISTWGPMNEMAILSSQTNSGLHHSKLQFKLQCNVVSFHSEFGQENYQPSPIIFDTSKGNFVKKCAGYPACSGNGFCLPNSNKCICNSNFTGDACNCENFTITKMLSRLFINSLICFKIEYVLEGMEVAMAKEPVIKDLDFAFVMKDTLDWIVQVCIYLCHKFLKNVPYLMPVDFSNNLRFNQSVSILESF